MRISDWSSDVCSSDLPGSRLRRPRVPARLHPLQRGHRRARRACVREDREGGRGLLAGHAAARGGGGMNAPVPDRSEEHTSELQSLMRISYAVFCLKKKKTI